MVEELVKGQKRLDLGTSYKKLERNHKRQLELVVELAEILVMQNLFEEDDGEGEWKMVDELGVGVGKVLRRIGAIVGMMQRRKRYVDRALKMFQERYVPIEQLRELQGKFVSFEKFIQRELKEVKVFTAP